MVGWEVSWRLVGWLFFSRLVVSSLGWLVSSLFSRLVGRLVDRLVGSLFSRLVGRLVDRLVGALFSRLVDRLVCFQLRELVDELFLNFLRWLIRFWLIQL